jgi:hypothetical protein
MHIIRKGPGSITAKGDFAPHIRFIKCMSDSAPDRHIEHHELRDALPAYLQQGRIQHNRRVLEFFARCCPLQI